MNRRSGILLPIASLPSAYGIGDFGPAALHFVDWLHSARQRVWELLPLQVPDSFGSPFDSCSALALNWLLVSPELLVRQNLVSEKIVRQYKIAAVRVDYQHAHVAKRAIIGCAWETFQHQATPEQRARFSSFRRREKWWLDDYALFMAIKDRHSGRPWWKWAAALRNRQPAALNKWARAHAGEIAYFAFGQWLAQEQWLSLKKYANQQRISTIGDLPYYVVRDSVDVWAYRKEFFIDSKGRIRSCSGAPPDMFYHLGQLWGNPIYNWAAQARTGFRWFMRRFARSLALYDELRLDHFRGYVSVWSVPIHHRNARRGRWVPVPGRRIFAKVRKRFPHARLYAEDLGNITDEVYGLRDRADFVGMRILQFGFHRATRATHDPKTYPVQSVGYFGTHDMSTLRGWLTRTTAEERHLLYTMFEQRRRLPSIDSLFGLLYRSKSALVIAQMQNILKLNDTARMNRPGIIHALNWTWRLPPKALTAHRAASLYELTKRSGR